VIGVYDIRPTTRTILSFQLIITYVPYHAGR
jgi:hypothetical protein